MTPKDIQIEYAYREKEAGGLPFADVSQIITDIAREHGLDRAHVKDVLEDHWCLSGAG